MNIARARTAPRKSRLENEVILAVVALYVLLSAALLVIHYWAPAEGPALTSSTSPSHAARAAVPAPAPAVVAPAAIAPAPQASPARARAEADR